MDELLRAVISAPDDDAPRSVYADALMRRGDPRGEFIALQLATTPSTTPSAAPSSVPGAAARAAAERAAELLAEHRAEWLAAMPNVLDARFERGFAAAVALRCHPPEGAALACCDVEPIRDVTLVCDEPEDDDGVDHVAIARWFAADARTARLRMLDLTRPAGPGWGQKPIAILLAADLRCLRELRIADGDCLPHTARAIATLDHLTTLAFHGDSVADLDDGVARLAASPRSASLETLVMTDCGLTAAAGIALGASPHLTHLRSLVLGGGSYQANRLLDEGALALARSPTLTALAELSLVHNDVTDTFLEALASPAALPALTNLAVNSCKRVTSRGVAALATSPRFATMQQLWLGGCRIDDDGLIALARSPHAGALRAINLHGNPLTADGARALAASPLAATLEHLAITLTPELEVILRPAFGERLNRGR